MIRVILLAYLAFTTACNTGLVTMLDLGTDMALGEDDAGVESANYTSQSSQLPPGYHQLGCGFDACEPPPSSDTTKSNPVR